MIKNGNFSSKRQNYLKTLLSGLAVKWVGGVVTQLLPRAMQLSARSGRYVREANMGQLAE